ncbi:uncharacterized protein WM294_012840 isoform 2-T3 [Sarcoramphus papa]
MFFHVLLTRGLHNPLPSPSHVQGPKLRKRKYRKGIRYLDRFSTKTPKKKPTSLLPPRSCLACMPRTYFQFFLGTDKADCIAVLLSLQGIGIAPHSSLHS